MFSTSARPRLGPMQTAKTVASLLDQVLTSFNALLVQNGTLGPYIASFVSTDSHDTLARRLESELAQVSVRLTVLSTRFQALVGSLGPRLDDVLAANENLGRHAFALREMAEQSRYLMSEELEGLAAELSLNSTTLWSNLQGVITSQLTADFELDGEVQKLPLPALINLHSHPDEDVRRRAYEAELALLASVREPLAACMNGIKGTANTLNRRRGRTDALHEPVDRARIDRETLDAMLVAMADSFPTFRKYWQKKAQRLGKDQLAWWDVWAPAPQNGGAKKSYSFEEARGLHPQELRLLLAQARRPGAARVRRALDRRRAAARQARRRVLHEGVGAARVARAEQLRRHARPGVDPRARAGPRVSTTSATLPRARPPCRRARPWCWPRPRRSCARRSSCRRCWPRRPIRPSSSRSSRRR